MSNKLYNKVPAHMPPLPKAGTKSTYKVSGKKLNKSVLKGETSTNKKKAADSKKRKKEEIYRRRKLRQRVGIYDM